MHEARQAQIGDVCARKDMVHKETRKLRMGSVLPLRSPACDGRLGAPTELSIGFIEWAPRLALAAHIQLEQLSQVMAESGSERGVLPARAVAGTAETIHAAVWPLLHLHVAFELFQSLERSRATRSFPEGHSKTQIHLLHRFPQKAAGPAPRLTA